MGMKPQIVEGPSTILEEALQISVILILLQMLQKLMEGVYFLILKMTPLNADQMGQLP